MNKELLKNIPKEKFELAPQEGRLHDKKLETKPIGYFKDAFLRFKKDKASVVGAIILIILVIYALIGPYFCNQDYVKSYETDSELRRYQYLLPKLSFMDGTGVWDGTKKTTVSEATYNKYVAMGEETGSSPIQKLYEVKVMNEYDPATLTTSTYNLYVIQLDTYRMVDVFTKQLSLEEYQNLQQWQIENDTQVILPWVDYYDKASAATSPYSYSSQSQVKLKDYNVWYACNEKGNPILDENGDKIPAYRDKVKGYIKADSTYKTYEDDYNSLKLENDPGTWAYALKGGSAKLGYNYTIRVDAYEYFKYKYGFEPAFIFGTNGEGYDIFTRLASGARFSLLFAVAISSINLVIGAIYGAIEGYYGGAADLIMERISDLLSAIPGMVVTVLFNLHLSGTVGVVVSLLFSFILTGWIGMASRTRMQFYRFKNQEYVLAARTLGAKDWRIMFKHIFPNSLGTIITGSVLAIPGVIFSETSLTYLGIINLDSPTRSSVGAMLSAGQKLMTTYPHMVFFPALFIGLLMVAFNLFGNGLRDAFNPSLRGAED